jgi:4-hydroxyphenylacetate 3-monooxygenase
MTAVDPPVSNEVWAPHEVTAMRGGREFLDSLRDGRAVYLDGQRVADVTAHPAFAMPLGQVAAMYDLARDTWDRATTTYQEPASGQRTSAMWLVPRSSADLALRRQMHRAWSECSGGMMGRTADSGASILTGFASTPDVFARGGQQFADNLLRFYAKARDEDLFIPYAVVPPQVDRTKPAHKQPEPFLYPGVVRERDDGIVLRGAQMIATSAVMANYLLVTYITPLAPGDDDYAFCAVLPASAEGLRIYPRRPYGTIATSVYDYPLSSRFDEIDTMIVLKDVFVPWEHVFIYRNVDVVNAQWHDTPAHLLVNFHTLIRFCVKMEFIAGLALRLVELHNLQGLPPVQGQLGAEIALVGAQIDALAHAAETLPLVRDGVARPHPLYVYAAMNLQRRLAPDLMRSLREFAGGAFIAVPSSAQAFESAETAEDTRRYYRGATAPAEQRVKLLKLIWDLVGTEFGGRQLQYDMFYSAAQHVADMRMYRWYDWRKAGAAVDRCLDGY